MTIREAPRKPQNWNDCESHDWREKIDSQYSDEKTADVECIHCGCPGSQNRKTGDTYWPAT